MHVDALWRMVCVALVQYSYRQKKLSRREVEGRGIGEGHGGEGGQGRAQQRRLKEVDAHGHALSGARPWFLGHAGTQRAKSANVAAPGKGDRRRDHRG
jgi:hypothetical protein